MLNDHHPMQIGTQNIYDNMLKDDYTFSTIRVECCGVSAHVVPSIGRLENNSYFITLAG